MSAPLAVWLAGEWSTARVHYKISRTSVVGFFSQNNLAPSTSNQPHRWNALVPFPYSRLSFLEFTSPQFQMDFPRRNGMLGLGTPIPQAQSAVFPQVSSVFSVTRQGRIYQLWKFWILLNPLSPLNTHNSKTRDMHAFRNVSCLGALLWVCPVTVQLTSIKHEQLWRTPEDYPRPLLPPNIKSYSVFRPQALRNTLLAQVSVWRYFQWLRATDIVRDSSDCE